MQGEGYRRNEKMIRKRIFKNTFVNSIGKILSFAFQMAIVSYLVKNLGKEAYGSIVLALALAANIQLLEAGFGIGVTKYIAEFNAKGEKKRLLEIINTNIIVTTVFVIIFACIIFLINEFLLAKIFTLPPNLLSETKSLIRILIPASIIEFWSVSIIRVAEGFQKYFAVRLIEVAKWGLRLLFVVIAVKNGYGLTGVGLAYLGAGAIIMIVLYLSIFAADQNLKINPFLINRETFKLLFGFSIWVFLSKIFSFLSYRVDVILIGIFLSPVYVTYYDIAFKIYEALKFGILVIASALVPVSSELGAMTDRRRLELLFNKVSKYTLVFVFPQLVFAIFYAEGIINMWIGKGVEVSVLLTQLFAVSLFFFALTSSGAEIMVGLNKVKELAFCGGIAALINFAISIILVKTIGVAGPVIGTIVGTIILSAGRLYLMLPLFNLSFLEFLKRILLKPVISTIIFAVVFFFIVSRNLYIGATVLMFYLIFSTLIMVDAKDRREFVKV